MGEKAERVFTTTRTKTPNPVRKIKSGDCFAAFGNKGRADNVVIQNPVLISLYKMISRKIFIFLLLAVSSCSDNLPETQIPLVSVDETINLTNQQYLPLQTVGGYVYIPGGLRGIILYRESQRHYLAIERNCSYQPTDDCATVEVEDSGFFLVDPCCESTFDLRGNPTGGPAIEPLRLYHTELDGNFLIISNMP